MRELVFALDYELGCNAVADTLADHPKHDHLAPHGGRRGTGEDRVRAFVYTVAARYLDNGEEMVRERYSHIEARELGDVATEPLSKVDDYVCTTSSIDD